MIDGFTSLRLSVQEWSQALNDPEARKALEVEITPMLSPEVLTHLPPAVQNVSKGAGAWMEARAEGACVYTVRAGELLIGLMFLMDRDGPDAPLHVGYMLRQSAWAQGYASELMRGCIAALQLAGLSRPVMGGVAQDNSASARVLVKSGFVLCGTADGVDMYRFDP